jgi:hypothetical protein
MTKTVISAYLIAQALLHYAMLLFQSVPQDVVEAVVDVDNTMLKFSLGSVDICVVDLAQAISFKARRRNG